MPLLNLPNPPAGFDFAKNGLGQQTSTLIQSASSLLNDTAKQVIGSLPKPPKFEFTLPANLAGGPSLTATMESIKSGEINKSITASLNKIGDVSSSLPADVSAGLASAQAAVAAKMAEAQTQLPKLMAVAQANMDLTTKTALANGAPPTEAQLKAASGALAIFQDGPKMLEEQAAGVSKLVAEAGSSFGAKLPAALNTAGNFAKAGLDKVTNLATTAGASITSFASGVPSETIPDPSNPSGPAIPNPAFAAFSAIPENASKLSSLSGLSTALAGAAGSLTSAFGAIESKANAAFSSGIADLKAFGFAASLAQPAGGIMATARSVGVDMTKVDPSKINKVIAQAAASNPAQPPKAEDAVVKAVKLTEPVVESTPPTPKTAIFGEDPSKKIEGGYIQAYFNQWKETNEFFKALASKFPEKLDAFYPNYTAIKNRAEEVLKAKSDPATRTAEETYFVEKRSKLRALVSEHFKYFKNYEKVGKQTNVRADQYNLFKKLYNEDKRYGDCPLSIETALKTSAVLSDEEELLYYDTYADLIKAKPEVALPDSLDKPFSG
jgi:hypothetical protein